MIELISKVLSTCGLMISDEKVKDIRKSLRKNKGDVRLIVEGAFSQITDEKRTYFPRASIEPVISELESAAESGSEDSESTPKGNSFSGTLLESRLRSLFASKAKPENLQNGIPLSISNRLKGTRPDTSGAETTSKEADGDDKSSATLWRTISRRFQVQPPPRFDQDVDPYEDDEDYFDDDEGYLGDD